MKSCVKWALPVGALLLIVVGCTEEAALRVDDVSFTESQLIGLSEPQIEALTLLTVLGIGVSRGEVEGLGEAFVQSDVDDLVLRRLDEEEALTGAGIDEGALERWYFGHPESELVVRHLVILTERWDSPELRTASANRARAALDRVRQGESFPAVAGEVSEEPGAEARGGLLEPGREGSWVREFWNAAEALAPGEVSEVVESQYGFHVLKLEERRVVPFGEARQSAVSRLVSEMALLPTAGRLPSPRPLADGDRDLRLAEAARRGVKVTPSERSEILGRWVAQVERWGETFGFSRGMAPDEISGQAMVALGLSGQEAVLSRMELLELAGPSLATYSITRTLP